MKKSLISATTILLFFSLSCKKAASVDPAACSGTLSTDFSAAFTAFSADPTNKTKCQNAINILGRLVDCPFVSATDKTSYQEFLKEKPCDNL